MFMDSKKYNAWKEKEGESAQSPPVHICMAAQGSFITKLNYYVNN